MKLFVSERDGYGSPDLQQAAVERLADAKEVKIPSGTRVRCQDFLWHESAEVRWVMSPQDRQSLTERSHCIVVKLKILHWVKPCTLARCSFILV